MTTYRQGCGTHMGMLLHKAEGEQPCGECLEGELLRRVSVEEWPARPSHPLRRKVTAAEAEQHRADLLAALADPKPATTKIPEETPNG